MITKRIETMTMEIDLEMYETAIQLAEVAPRAIAALALAEWLAAQVKEGDRCPADCECGDPDREHVMSSDEAYDIAREAIERARALLGLPEDR